MTPASGHCTCELSLHEEPVGDDRRRPVVPIFRVRVPDEVFSARGGSLRGAERRGAVHPTLHAGDHRRAHCAGLTHDAAVRFPMSLLKSICSKRA